MTKSRKSSKKSYSQMYNDREKSHGIPDLESSFGKVDYRKIEDKIFPTKLNFVKKDENSERLLINDSASCIIPNDPQYIGFRQTPPGRITNIPEQILQHFGNRIYFIGWQGCAYLAEHPFIYKACVMPGEDALECGFRIVPRGTKNKKVMDKIEDVVNDDNFGLTESLRKFEYNKRVFGFGFAIPCFEEGYYDEATNNNGVRMDVPLVDYMQLKGKHFIGWSIVDPYWITPEFDDESQSNPAYKDYFRPTWWKINPRGVSIHKSWIVKIDNTMMADITAPTYLWGGISIPQLCYERVYAADKCANEAPMVALSKRLLAVTNCNLRKMAGDTEFARRQFNNLEYGRNNWGVIALDRNQDIKQVDTVLAEFNQLITTQYQLFCGIVEVPAPKMMMSPLTGFANSGQYELKVYAANCKKIQGNEYNILLKRTYRIQAATMGLDMRFDVEWGEIDIPTLVEQAEMKYEEARAEKFHAEAGAVKKMAMAKSAETHKSVNERLGNE